MTFLCALIFVTLVCSVHSENAAAAEGVKVDLPYPLGDVRNCAVAGMQGRDPTSSKPLSHMDVLPGLGFDALRTLDLGQVLDFNNYSTCQVSGDGLFLIPDNVYLIPIQRSKVDVFADYLDTFQSYTSLTAKSINAHLKYSGVFSSISGTFSEDYQDTKSKMVDHNSNAARVSLRYHLYTVHISPDAQLHPTFKLRLLEIAANIQNNNTKLAHYLSELLVRDYGTHVITSIDAGAGLSQTTFVSEDFLRFQENRSLVISASASAGFFDDFKVSAGIKTTVASNYINQFQQKTTNSHILTYGGPMFRVGNFSLTDWEDGVLDHLVAIDRSGVPLYSVINTNNLPDIPDTTVLAVMNYVYRAVRRYYMVNTLNGCLDPKSPKFNFQANVNDNSCDAHQANYTFGGIFQTCSMNKVDNPICSVFHLCENVDDICGSIQQTNPLTQDYRCPAGYTAVLLHTGTVSKGKQHQRCEKHCSWLVFCHERCSMYEVVSSATYSAYWCAYQPDKPAPTDFGYMFGGVYTSKQQNILTGSHSCPPYFYPLHFGEDIWVCVSSDTNGAPHSVPFGGFDSCTNGNALAASAEQFQLGNYPHRCGYHYSQFLVTVDEGCEINFCADIVAIKQQLPHPPKVPPYHALPHMSHNVTNTLVVRGMYGTIWLKKKDGTWEKYEDNQKISSKEYLKSLATEAVGNSNSAGMIAGIVLASVFGTSLLGVAIALMTFGVCKARRSRRKQERGNTSAEYLVLHDDNDAAIPKHGSMDVTTTDTNNAV